MSASPEQEAGTPVSADAAHASTAQARISALTDVGRTREHNEDAFLVADLDAREPMEFPTVGDGPTSGQPTERSCGLAGTGILLIVADGLGGAAAGEVASHLAVRVAHETLRRALADRPAAEANGALRDPVAAGTALRDAVLAANAAIHQLGAERAELHGMASTITAALLRDDGVTVAQVGDSRAYVVRGREARQITKDQSLVQRLVDAGEMTPEQAETSLRRNIILQALGPETSVRVDVTRQELCRGDLLLLCSDGLSGQVRAARLAELTGEQPDPGALCTALVAAANASGGPDNITVIAARVSGDGFPLAPGEAAEGDCEEVAVHRVALEPTTDEVPIPATAAAPPSPFIMAALPTSGITGLEDAPPAALDGIRPDAPPPDLGPAAGVSRGELASRRGRVQWVYALLAAAAVIAGTWTWWAFAR